MTDGRRDDFDLAPLEAALAPYGVRIAARRIRAGDEEAFGQAASGAVPDDVARRRSSGAARLAARRILSGLGLDPFAPLSRSSSGAPVWPDGIAGSLAHDEDFAVAVVARRGALVGLGVDIEPAAPLPSDLVDFVLTDAERRETADDGVGRRSVFAAKEAVYKAIHPLDGTPLEYADIEIRLSEGTAILRDGRRLRLLTLRGERLIAVALAFGTRAAVG